MLMIEDKIAKIVNALDIPSEMGIHRDSDDYCWACENMEDDLYRAHIKNVNVYHGASKIALVPNDTDVVIKIPFTGYFYTGEHYNEETGEYETDEEDSYEPFCYAGTENGWDYCQKEWEVYEQAVEDEMEKFFAKTVYYGEKDNMPIYLQQKAIAYSDSDESHKSSDRARRIYREHYMGSGSNDYCIFSSFWAERFIDYYDLNTLIALNNYVKKLGLHDFHGGNVGFTAEGVPVLIDYSSWNEDF